MYQSAESILGVQWVIRTAHLMISSTYQNSIWPWSMSTAKKSPDKSSRSPVSRIIPSFDSGLNSIWSYEIEMNAKTNLHSIRVLKTTQNNCLELSLCGTLLQQSCQVQYLEIISNDRVIGLQSCISTYLYMFVCTSQCWKCDPWMFCEPRNRQTISNCVTKKERERKMKQIP